MLFYRSAFIRFTLVLGILSVCFTSCDPGEQQASGPNTYYDLKDFVNNQTVLLEKGKPLVQKTVISNGKREILETSEVNWKRELALFLQADLNKAAYGNSYKTIKSDSLHYEYVLKPGEKLPVQYLRVVLDKVGGSPAWISAQIVTKNRLYTSEKNIELRCANYRGQWTIISYLSKGFQKLALMDAKVFEVDGKIKR
jgi:hypothetical protein